MSKKLNYIQPCHYLEDRGANAGHKVRAGISTSAFDFGALSPSLHKKDRSKTQTSVLAPDFTPASAIETGGETRREPRRDTRRDTRRDPVAKELQHRWQAQEKFVQDMQEEYAGDSAVDAGERASTLRVVVPHQVHGSDIVCIDQARVYRTHGIQIINLHDAPADGLYSFDANIILGVTVADCAGILLYEPESNFIAALHSGWKGTTGQTIASAHSNISANSPSILQRCIEEIVLPKGIGIGKLCAWISPCARQCCYEVSQELAQYFAKYPQSVHKHGDAVHIDLSQYIACQMQDFGMRANNIVIDPNCTICNEEYHSYRRASRHVGNAQIVPSTSNVSNIQAATSRQAPDANFGTTSGINSGTYSSVSSSISSSVGSDTNTGGRALVYIARMC